MRRATQLALSSTLVAGLFWAGCEGNGGPVLTPDGGPTDAGPLPPDAPAIDRERPRVVGTDPTQGATGVGADATISIELSEPMDTAAGTVRVEVGGAAVDADTSWNAAGTELTIDPSASLPSEARLRVVLEDDFADLAGNTLALPFVLTFDVGDHDAPVVVSSDPAQGATGLSARMATMTIAFDELMLADRGTVSLEGGSGAVGALTWIDGHTVRAAVSGLAYESSYRAVLAGFEDASGNALDTTVYLDAGAIEFETASDDDAPRIADSVPAEGQVNVALRGTPSVVFVFDEPMDTTVGTATLSAGGASTVLVPTWSVGGTRLALAVAGRLYPDAPHAVELVGFRDVRGNALDLVTYLGDGRLDFDTGADATLPIVVFSYPNEGSADADHLLTTIEIAFDRAMNTSTTALRVDDEVAPFDAPVTWNAAGTRARLDVTNRIHAGRAHAVDLRGMVDLAGDPVDPDHPYLADGILDFSTRAPRGEQCRDELRVTEATSATAGGGYEWVIAETSMSVVDNGRACQYPGASASISPDAVILYRKTTASGSAGGRYLHVTLESPGVGSRATLAIYQNACGEAAGAGPSARLTCQWDRYRWEQYLDVGAGDYYVWAALTGTTTLGRIVVRIEEVDAVPDGESCASPYTAASPQYTAPSAPGGEHVWAIPEHGYQGADMDRSWPGAGAASCDADQVQGTDFVVRFDKTRADSLVSVVVEPGPETNSAIYRLNVEAMATCDASAATGLACTSGIYRSTAASGGPRRLTFAAPAGATYLWVANDEQDNHSVSARVRIQEIDDVAGSSCANAIVLPATGSTAITPTSPARMDQPSCFAGAWEEGITWYRLTSTANATVVRADVAGSSTTVGAVALFEAATRRELGCTTDAASLPQLALLAPGADVCIAVRNGSGVARLDTTQVSYDGVMGVPTNLAIERPFDATGAAEQAITSETWMALTPTTLYMGVSSGSTATSTNGVVIAPLAGAARGEYRSDFTTIGNGGVSVGEQIWSLDDFATSGSTARLYRLVNSSGTWGPIAWEGGMSWPADGFDAIAYDGTSLLVVNDYASTTLPVQLRTFAPGAAGPSTAAVSIDAALRNVVAVAADTTWLYLAGAKGSGTTLQEGVYRVQRAALGTATAEWIANIDISITRAAMVIDSSASASYLYIRDDDGNVHVVVNPGGTPVHLGVISSLGTGSDDAMAYEPLSGSLYVFETETVTTGNFVRLD